MSKLRYTVSPVDPHAHCYTVTLEIPTPDPDGQVVTLPAWIRGSYKIRDFARHVVKLQASCGEAAVEHQREDKSTWRFAPCDGPLRIVYRVHAHDASVREAFLDATRGFFNPAVLCLRVVGQERMPCELVLERPPRSIAGWSVATALSALDVDGDGFGCYAAEDYECLIDHPFALGALLRVDFEVDGIPHQLALSGRCAPDVARLRADLAAVCSTERALFGHQPALDRYVFLCTVQPQGYGGLEHRASSALVCARDSLPGEGAVEQSLDYRTFLGVVAHEYFHLWNVKRITPQRLADSRLDREAYTGDLWAYEGVTSYYDDLLLLRAERIDAATWLDLLAATATRFQRAPGRESQTLADASFDAWTKFYQPDANTPNATVSYYLKGALVALCLDLRLRRDAALSLDELMRALWQRYGACDEAVPEGGLERLATELSGLDLAGFFQHALRSTGELPIVGLLADFGVQAELRVNGGAQDRGGRITGRSIKVDAGLQWSKDGRRVIYVRSESPAEAAGLAPGDEPVALDGWRVDGANWQRRLDRLDVGDTAPVHYFRGDELHRSDLPVVAAQPDTWTFTLVKPLDDPTIATRRRAWLGV